MAMQYDGITFDTVDELIEYKTKTKNLIDLSDTLKDIPPPLLPLLGDWKRQPGGPMPTPWTPPLFGSPTAEWYFSPDTSTPWAINNCTDDTSHVHEKRAV